MPPNLVKSLLQRIPGLKPRLPAHVRTGKKGEALARRYLEEQGMLFLAANVRIAHFELDLLMIDGECLVIVEVKTLQASQSQPGMAITRNKQEHIMLASHYLWQQLGEPQLGIRFDLVEVMLHRWGLHTVHHTRNAFNPRSLAFTGKDSHLMLDF